MGIRGCPWVCWFWAWNWKILLWTRPWVVAGCGAHPEKCCANPWFMFRLSVLPGKLALKAWLWLCTVCTWFCCGTLMKLGCRLAATGVDNLSGACCWTYCWTGICMSSELASKVLLAESFWNLLAFSTVLWGFSVTRALLLSYSPNSRSALLRACSLASSFWGEASKWDRICCINIQIWWVYLDI